jgi:hypothetical protein
MIAPSGGTSGREAAMSRQARRWAAAAVATAAVLGGPAPAAHAARTPAIYAGTTSAGDPIVLQVDRRARVVRRVVAMWRATCTDGRAFPFLGPLVRRAGEPVVVSPRDGNVLFARRIGRRGAWRGRALTAAGNVAIVQRLTARIRGAGASGTIRARVAVADPATGAVTTTCTVRTAFRALRRAGGIYGGQTNQGGPVAIDLTGRRRQVDALLVGWQSRPCASGQGLLQIGDVLTNLRLRGGTFRGPITQDIPRTDGGRTNVRWAVRGRVRPRRVTGTYQVTVNITNPDGTTDRCATPRLRFRAVTERPA